MIYELIMKAQQGDEEAILCIIEKFNSLIWKYARKLGYEDAYYEMILFFIELIKKVRLEQFEDLNDGCMVSYIAVCIRNQYVYLMKKLIRRKKEINFCDLSEEQKYNLEESMAKEDQKDSLKELELGNILTDEENFMIYQIYELGYSATELSYRYNCSRQAVNQKKKRVLQKIERWMVET